jgi:hypothetical protein
MSKTVECWHGTEANTKQISSLDFLNDYWFSQSDPVVDLPSVVPFAPDRRNSVATDFLSISQRLIDLVQPGGSKIPPMEINRINIVQQAPFESALAWPL